MPAFVVFMAQSNRHPIIEWLSVAILLLVYGAIALAHATLAPLTTGPDELAHYEYLNFIADNNRLPLNTAEREQAGYKSDQPPLYHLLAALPAGLVNVTDPPLLKRVSDHPRRQLIERTRHAWGLYNTLNEQWPYRHEVLRWQIGRWVAVSFGLLTVLITYLLARWFFAGRRPLALAAAATVAFVPRFTLTGSMLNYETLLALLAALFLWSLLALATYREAGFWWPLVVGLLGGLSIVAKLSALILPLEIFIALWLIGRHYQLPWQSRLRRLTIAALGVLLPVGLWYGFVMVQFNTIAQDGLWTGLLRPLIAADASDATTNQLLSLLTGGEAGFTAAIENLDSGPPWEWAAIFYRTFWSVGIEGVQPLGTAGLAVAGALVAIAIAGLIVTWVNAGAQGSRGAGKQRRQRNKDIGTQSAIRNPQSVLHPFLSPRLALLLLLLHLLLPLVLPFIRYAVTFSLADTAQGRHVLFQAAPAFALLLVWGLFSAGEQLQQRFTNKFTGYSLQGMIFIPGLFLLTWSLVQLQTMRWAYLPPLPVTTQAERVPPMQHRLDVALSPYISLVGYSTQLEPGTRLLRVDFWWQADAVSPVDYLTEAALLDEENNVLAEWQGHPAGGRYPTRAWDPGDIVQDTVWLPVAGLDADEYTLAIHLRPSPLNTRPRRILSG